MLVYNKEKIQKYVDLLLRIKNRLADDEVLNSIGFYEKTHLKIIDELIEDLQIDDKK